MTSEFCQAEYEYQYYKATVLGGAAEDSPEVAALLAAKYSCFADYGIDHVENDCSALALRNDEATYQTGPRPAASFELSKNMLTGERNSITPSGDPPGPANFFTSLETFFIGSFNSFYYGDRIDEGAAALLWVLEPSYAGFVRDRVNLAEGAELGSESFGKFLLGRGRHLSQEAVAAEAERIFFLKQAYDDPLLEAGDLSLAALVNDYSPPADFGPRSAADKVTGVLRACAASPYFGQVIADLDTLFYYNRPLEPDSLISALAEQALSAEHAAEPAVRLFQEAEEDTPAGEMREELLALWEDPLVQEVFA